MHIVVTAEVGVLGVAGVFFIGAQGSEPCTVGPLQNHLGNGEGRWIKGLQQRGGGGVVYNRARKGSVRRPRFKGGGKPPPSAW